MNPLTTQRGNNKSSEYSTRTSSIVDRASTHTPKPSIHPSVPRTPPLTLTNRHPNISKGFSNSVCVTPLTSSVHPIKGIPSCSSSSPSGTSSSSQRLPPLSSLLASLLQKDYRLRLKNQTPGGSPALETRGSTGLSSHPTLPTSSRSLDLQRSTTPQSSPHSIQHLVSPNFPSPINHRSSKHHHTMIGVVSASMSDDDSLIESGEVVHGEEKGDRTCIAEDRKDGILPRTTIVDSLVSEGEEQAENGVKLEAISGSGIRGPVPGEAVLGAEGQRKGPLFSHVSSLHPVVWVGEPHIMGSDNNYSHQATHAHSSSSPGGEYYTSTHHPQLNRSDWSSYSPTPTPSEFSPPVTHNQSILVTGHHRSVTPSGHHYYQEQQLVPVIERGGLLYHAYPYPIQSATLPSGSNGYPYSQGYFPAPNQSQALPQPHSPQPPTYHSAPPASGYQGHSPLDRTALERSQSDQQQGFYQQSSPLGTPSKAPTRLANASLSNHNVPSEPSQVVEAGKNTSSQPYTPSLSPINSTEEDDQDMGYGRDENPSLGYTSQSQLGLGVPTSGSGVTDGSRAPSNMIVEEESSNNTAGDHTPVEMTDYEKERLANIKTNDMMMMSLGLGGHDQAPATYNSHQHHAKRKSSTVNLKAHPNEKRKKARSGQNSVAPARISTRIASMSRTVSYANLNGGSDVSNSADGSFSSQGDEEEDDWERSEQSGGQTRRGGPRSNVGKHRNWGGGKTKPRFTSFNDPTLRDLVDDHPQVREIYPLFYHACSPEMLITNDAFPLIGSVPSTCTPSEKAEYLRGFYHKGRRCIAQLDAFTARCEKKYDGPGHKWKELNYAMKIAIRDIRRKGVERCENYKYTRRDLLNRALGKTQWQPIEDDWIPWTVDSSSNDPAGDLEGFVLLSPPPHPAQPRLPRADPLMQGLQQPIVSASARSKNQSRRVKVKEEVVDMRQGVNETMSRQTGGYSQPPAGLFHDFPISSPIALQAGNEDIDSEIDVDEEEARLEEERQRQLAIQQSQQRYDHSGFQVPVHIQPSYGLYSSIRGGDNASAGSDSVFPGQNFGPLPILQTGASNGNYQHLNVEVQNIPMSSHSTYSHPLSSAHSHHELMEQGMGMMSGGMDMSFHTDGNVDGQGMSDAPIHGYHITQPQMPFQVGVGTIYSNMSNYNQVGMQSEQWHT